MPLTQDSMPDETDRLTRRSVYEQQQAEAEDGEHTGEARTIVEGFGNHRFGGHREQRASSKPLEARWPGPTQRTESNIPCRNCDGCPDRDRNPQNKDVWVTATRGPHPGRARQGAVTKISPVGEFWTAEPEHQDYLERYPHGYTCHFPRPGWKLPRRTAAATSGIEAPAQ